MVPALLLTGLRWVIAFAFIISSIIALTYWAVRARRLSPFGGWARFVRRGADPILKPLERRLVRSGANPQDAPLWLVGIVVVGGLVTLSAVTWLTRAITLLAQSAGAGPRGILHFLLDLLFNLLMVMLLIRVVASWLGLSPYSRWMRPVVLLTEWLLEPIRRLLPPIGMFDFSPFVAYLLLYLARWLVLSQL